MSYENSEYGVEEPMNVDEVIERMTLKYSNLDQVSGRIESSDSSDSKDSSLKSKNLEDENSTDISEEDDLMDFLKKMRRENEGLKANLQDLLSSRKSEGGEAQLRKLESDVHRNRQQYDRLKHDIRTVERKIRKKEEELQFLRKTHLQRKQKQESPSNMKKGRGKRTNCNSSSSTRKGLEEKEKHIRILENRLDKTIIKLNESQMIKETYVKILKRLKKERMGFDNQLRSIEKTLKSKNADYELLRKTFHEANYLKELSKNELKQARLNLSTVKKQKQKELNEKKKDILSRIKNTESLNKRKQKTNEMEMELEGYVSTKKNTELQKANILEQFSQLENESVMKKKQKNLFELKAIWRKIKEITGESTPKQVISKYYSSNSTFKNLEKVTKNSQQKIDLLSQKRNNYKSKLESLKFTSSSSVSGGMGTKRMVDEFIQQLNDSKARLEKHKKNFQNLKNIFINLKFGLKNLVVKLQQMFEMEQMSEEEEEEMNDQEFIIMKIQTLQEILEKHFKKFLPVQPIVSEGGAGGDGKGLEEKESQPQQAEDEKEKEEKEKKIEEEEEKLFKKEDENLYNISIYNNRSSLKLFEKIQSKEDTRKMIEEDEDLVVLLNSQKLQFHNNLLFSRYDENDDEEDDEDWKDEKNVSGLTVVDHSNEMGSQEDDIEVLDRKEVKKRARLALAKHKSKNMKKN